MIKYIRRKDRYALSMTYLVRADTSILDNGNIFYEIGQALLNPDDTKYSWRYSTNRGSRDTSGNIEHGDIIEPFPSPDPSGFGTYEKPFDNTKRVTFDVVTGSEELIVGQLVFKGDFRQEQSYLREYKVIYYDYDPG